MFLHNVPETDYKLLFLGIFPSRARNEESRKKFLEAEEKKKRCRRYFNLENKFISGHEVHKVIFLYNGIETIWKHWRNRPYLFFSRSHQSFDQHSVSNDRTL